MPTKKSKKPEPTYLVISSEEIRYCDAYNSLEDAKKFAMEISEENDDDFTVVQIIGEAIFEPPEVPVSNVRYISHI